MRTYTLALDGIGEVPVSVTDQGTGPAVLLLHGGAGPSSVAGFARLLAESGHARVVAPVHPGFDGTPRPTALSTMPDLARLYAGLVEEMGLSEVTVVGNSIGGWIAAELALVGSPRISRVVLVDAVGLQLDDYPIVDFFSLSFPEILQRSYAQPEKFMIDPSSLSDAQQAGMAANREALKTYGGTTMADPTLLGRLSGITVPTLAVWGAADRVVLPEHGTAYVAAIADARFELIADAGHLPQLETPDRLRDLVVDVLG